jgi:hypothetical protein
MGRCSRIACAVAALLLSGLFGPGARASVTVLDDGANGGSAKILIQSAIHKGDLEAFEAAVNRVSRTANGRISGIPFITVELNSPGGDVVEAIGIGRVIYRHVAMTLVRPSQECVSACVFILMAGAVHTPIGAAIGVHKPMLVAWRNMSYAEAQAKYDGLMRYLRDYFRELGVSDDAYDIMMRTSSNDMHYFTWWEMDRLGLRGEGPGWRARFAERQAASAVQEARLNWSADATPVLPTATLPPPALPKVDEAWREVVFMPGDLYGKDYYAGVNIERQPFTLEPMDLNAQRLDWGAPDVAGFVIRLWDAIWAVLAPGWWLLAILLFEILRADPNNWPGHPLRRRRDQWRLKPFRPASVNTTSAPAPGRA